MLTPGELSLEFISAMSLWVSVATGALCITLIFTSLITVSLNDVINVSHDDVITPMFTG